VLNTPRWYTLGQWVRLVHLPSRASEESVKITEHKGLGTTSSNDRSGKWQWHKQFPKSQCV